MKALLAWLLPPMDWPGRRRSYHRVLWLACIPLGFWVLAALPVSYSLLVVFILAALLPALG